MRNYRAGLAKWQTADPMGYPDGWNALAYCNNGVTSTVDLWGCKRKPHGAHSVGVKSVVWTDKDLKTLTYGMDYYGQCSDGKIDSRNLVHPGSMVDGYTLTGCEITYIQKYLPAANEILWDTITKAVFSQFKAEEIPFTRKTNKQNENPHLEFEVELRCTITLHDKYGSVMPYTVSLARRTVVFSCEE